MGTVSHVFTHFVLELEVFLASGLQSPAPDGHRWVSPTDIPHEALPSLMKKAIEAALPGATLKRTHS
jgi:A/G-specific adenine glycosylase